jgi:hypothetical protein
MLCVGLNFNKTQKSRSSHDIVLLIATVSSTVTVAFFILTFSAGAACGYYFVRQRRKQSSLSNQPTEPLYDDVNAVPAAVEHQEQGLELTENVAYGSAKPMTH